MTKSLRDLRLEKGLTLAQVAEALDTGITGPSSWELGRYGPHPRLIPKIAELYGITPEQARRAVAESKRHGEVAGAKT
jgi:transcriptional regulator with XRE-family HTH domain